MTVDSDANLPRSDAGGEHKSRVQPTVGWIGVGNIGAPMAQRLVAAGFAMRVWAL